MTDISGVSIHALVREMWTKSKPASFFRTPDAISAGVTAPTTLSDKDIDNALSENRGYIDYLNGRMIKTRFGNKHSVDFALYNRDVGAGAGEQIVAKLLAAERHPLAGNVIRSVTVNDVHVGTVISADDAIAQLSNNNGSAEK